MDHRSLLADNHTDPLYLHQYHYLYQHLGLPRSEQTSGWKIKPKTQHTVASLPMVTFTTPNKSSVSIMIRYLHTETCIYTSKHQIQSEIEYFLPTSYMTLNKNGPKCKSNSKGKYIGEDVTTIYVSYPYKI